MAAATKSTLSRSSSWNDPYKEFELYLEKAHEEIGQVFHQLEASCRAKQKAAGSTDNVPSPTVRKHIPPPVPVRRLVRNNSNRKPGLKITDYYLTEKQVNRTNAALAIKKAEHGVNAKKFLHDWDICTVKAGLPSRRTSCPPLKSLPQSHVLPVEGNGNAQFDGRWHWRSNSRRGQRYFTTDLHFDGEGNIKSPYTHHLDSQSLNLWTSTLMAEFNNIIESELQRLGSGRDQRHFPPSCSPAEDEVFLSTTSNERGRTSQNLKSFHRRSQSLDNGKLSPWALMQLSLLDHNSPPVCDSRHKFNAERENDDNLWIPLPRPTYTDKQDMHDKPNSNYDLLVADSVTSDRTVTLSDKAALKETANIDKSILKSSEKTGQVSTHPSADSCGDVIQAVNTIMMESSDVDPLSSNFPLVHVSRTNELATSGTSRSVNPTVDSLNHSADATVSLETVEQLTADIEQVEREIFSDLDHLNIALDTTPFLGNHTATANIADRTDPCDASTALNVSPLLKPKELQDFLRQIEDSIRTTTEQSVRETIGDEKTDDSNVKFNCNEINTEATSTYDATTQTSPMSLSRSSSFLWVSDCNCSADSGQLNETGRVSVASNATSLLVSAPLSISRRSLPVTASETEGATEVNMDTSLSSLISGSSGLDCIETGQRSTQATPDSAADVEESSVSLSRSLDPLDCGVESGIGTGSPPPRDRRRRVVGPVMEKDGHASTGSESESESSNGDFQEDRKGNHVSNSSSKKREKVRRRETWERLRRRHSCKRAHSRRNKEKEVVWVRRESVETQTNLTDQLQNTCPKMDQNQERVLHKPPFVVVQSVSRPKLRPLHFRNGPDHSMTTKSSVSAGLYNTLETPRIERQVDMPSHPLSSPSAGSVKLALHSVLAMELSNKSSSAPLLKVDLADKPKHPKPASATSTPTEPHITLEASLTAARSHSESAFAELEAAEACRWLRAAGFPQYAQMYEDWQFPLDLNVVQRDHQFLDDDSLHALFRRLTILNRTAKLRSDSRPRPQGDESEEEDQECALSDQWTFQRHSRRWSRIVDIPDDSDIPSVVESNSLPPYSPQYSADVVDGDNEETLIDDNDRTSDPIILGSFRRSSSERLRHGAKSLLRRMESLRSRTRRRPPRSNFDATTKNDIVISGPQVIDVLSMEDRMKDLHCVDITPPDSATPSSTPSPDLNRLKSNFEMPDSPSATPSPCSSISQKSSNSVTKSQSKSGRRFFQRRSRTRSENQKDTLSDSECSPNYWRQSSTPKDANSNETAFWNYFDSPGGISLRWRPSVRNKPVRDLFTDDSRSPTAENYRMTDNKEMPTFRGKLHLNFKPNTNRNKATLLPSPEDDEPLTCHDSPSIPIIIRNSSYQEPSTPSGSYRETERKTENETFGHDSTSTGTATSGSHGESDYSPAQSCRTGAVVRWHSFRRGSSQSMFNLNQIVTIPSLSVGQLALLRKLALLRLTALLERHTSSSKPSWGWDLPKFMRKAKTPDYKDKSVFGVPLSITVQRTGESLPRPVLQALHELRQSALDQVGLFRKSGVRSRISKLKDMCEACGENETVDFTDQQPYDIADMVKQYFRELPEALLTTKLSETFITIFQVVPAVQRLEALRWAIVLLPDEHREALHTFLAFLTDVAALSSVNQMTASNLAVCLAPSLFHLPTTTTKTTATSPRRRKTVGVPDQRELSENKAAHECLLQMIKDYKKLFVVSEDMLSQCRCTYLEESVPVSLDDLHTVEFGDWQAYMNGCMAGLIKETKDKTRGWVAMNGSELRVDIAWKKVGDGHALRLWRISTEVEAPPAELLNRVLRERHLWDTSLVKWRLVIRLDRKAEVFHYTCATNAPPVTRDFCILRTWKNDLPRGTCIVAETSIEHSDAPGTPGVIRGIVLASRYLIEPCGAGKSRLVHISRIDTKGRSPEWFNKHYGHICALHIARIRDSFSHVADGPESKV